MIGCRLFTCRLLKKMKSAQVTPAAVRVAELQTRVVKDPSIDTIVLWGPQPIDTLKTASKLYKRVIVQAGPSVDKYTRMARRGWHAILPEEARRPLGTAKLTTVVAGITACTSPSARAGFVALAALSNPRTTGEYAKLDTMWQAALTEMKNVAFDAPDIGDLADVSCVLMAARDADSMATVVDALELPIEACRLALAWVGPGVRIEDDIKDAHKLWSHLNHKTKKANWLTHADARCRMYTGPNGRELLCRAPASTGLITAVPGPHNTLPAESSTETFMRAGPRQTLLTGMFAPTTPERKQPKVPVPTKPVKRKR